MASIMFLKAPHNKMSCALILILAMLKLVAQSILMKPITIQHFIHLAHNFCLILVIVQQSMFTQEALLPSFNHLMYPFHHSQVIM